MELIIMIALVFTVISWIGGAAGRTKPSSNRSFQGYSKTPAQTSSPSGGRTGMDASRSRQQVPGPKRQQAQKAGGERNRSNNSPLRKSTFNNHEESSSYLRDEIQEAKMLWDMNQRSMQKVNDDFNRFIERQHQEQQRMMQENKAIDR